MASRTARQGEDGGVRGKPPVLAGLAPAGVVTAPRTPLDGYDRLRDIARGVGKADVKGPAPASARWIKTSS
ncbi:hypothetical protein GGP73_002796 [Salinibacter ruber]|nr:hypothetical protein [Salinibacter ruber]